MQRPVVEPQAQADSTFPLSLTFDGGRCLIHLTRPKRLGPTRLSDLRLEVTNVKFPFDIDGGAQQFRHRRCRLDSATVSIEEEPLRLWLAAELRPAGATLDHLSYRRGVLELIGSLQEMETAPTVDFVFRGFIRASTEELRICLCELNIYGPTRRPAPQLAHHLLEILLKRTTTRPPGVPASTRHIGLSDLGVDPLWQLLRNTLPAAGWRIPEYEGCRLDKIQRHPGRLQLSFHLPEAEPSTAPHSGSRGPLLAADHCRFAAFQESKELFEGLEEELSRARLADAHLVLSAEMARQPEHPFLVTRALQFLAADSNRDEETRELAQRASEQFDDFLPALLARATVAERACRWADAIDAYTQVAEIADRRRDRREEIRALLAAGRVGLTDFPHLAQAAFEKVIKREPGNATALAQLAMLSEETGEWHRLVEIRREQIDSANNNQTRISLRLRVAETLLAQLHEVEQARRQYEACLALDAQSEAALRGMAQCYVAEGELPSAVAFLDRLVTLAKAAGNGEMEASYHLQISELREQEGQLANALSRSEHAYFIAPTSERALRRSADLFHKMGDPARAEGALRRLVLLCRSPQERMQIHLELAGLYSGPLGNNQAAMGEVQKALLISPADPGALDRLVSLSEDRGERDVLISTLKWAASNEASHDRRSDFLLRLGRLLARDPQSHADAIEVLGSAIECSEAAKIPALEALAEIHLRSERWEDACRSIAALGPDRTAGQWLVWAEGKFRQGDSGASLEGAEAGLRVARQQSDRSTQRRLLALLVDVYSLEGDPLACISPLEDLLADAPEKSEERIALLAQLADYKRALKDLKGALTMAKEGLALRPDQASAMDRLAGIHEQLHQYSDAQDVLDRRLANTSHQPIEERGNLLIRLADLAAAQERCRDAIEYLRQALREGVTGQLAERCRQGIVRFHLRRDDPGAAASAAEAWARAAEEATAAGYWYQAGDLWRKEAKDESRAARCFHEALARSPNHAAALDALEAYYSGRDDTEPLIEILRQKITAAQQHSARRRVLLVRLAEKLDELGERSEAVSKAREALDGDENHVSALDFLGNIAWQDRDWQSAKDAYQRLDLNWPTSDGEPNLRLTRFELWQRLADIARERESPDEEEDLLRRCLQRDKQHSDCFDRLKTLLDKPGREDALREFLEDYAPKTD